MNGTTLEYFNNKGFKLAHFAFDTVLLLAISIGNLLTVVSIQRKRTLTRKVTNKLVLSLACADLMVGLTAPLHGVLFTISDVHVFRMFCLVQDALGSIAMGASLYSLLLIAVERYMGICHPLLRQRWFTIGRIKLCICGIWAYTTVATLFCLAFQKLEVGMPCLMSFYLPVWVYEGVICINVMFIVSISCILYARIFYIAKRSRNKVVLYRSVSLVSTPITQLSNNLMLNVSVHGNKKPWQHTMKVNVVMAMVMGAFIITYVPFMVTSALRLALNMNTPSWIMAEETVMMVAVLNSCLNPCIYAWKFRDFRWAYRKAIWTPFTRLCVRCNDEDTNK